MPAVLKGETRSHYVSRCVPIALKEAGTKSTAHAVAKCGGIYDTRHKRLTANRLNPLRADPTRTATLRRLFEAELNRRFARIKRKIRQLVVEEDAFGLARRHKLTLSEEQDYESGRAIVASQCQGDEREARQDHSTAGATSGAASEGPTPENSIHEGYILESEARLSRLLAVHQVSSKYDEDRPSAALRGYDRQWRSVRKNYLKRWPWCRECLKKGKLVLATAVDHRSRRSGDHEQFWDQRGWQSLCTSCHNRKTATGNIATNTRWAFQTTPQQVEAFQGWLRTQVEADMFTTGEEAYWRTYVERGYRQGAGRAFDDSRVAQRAMLDDANAQQMAWYEGSREEFLRSSFGRPVAIEKVRLLAGRVFTDLKNVTEDMSTRISRQLTDGLVQGMNPREIARRMIRDGIGTKVRGVQSRALTIARTEIIRAHAEGQLDALEQLGVTQLGVMVEWATSGAFVCERCAPLHGMVLTIKEARGMLPQHPNCKCAWIPANVSEDQKKSSTITVVTKPTRKLKSGKRVPATTRRVTIPGQKRTQTEIQKAIDDSIRAEMPKIKKRTLAQQKARTSWAGADKRIAKRRPRATVEPVRPRAKPRPRAAPFETALPLPEEVSKLPMGELRRLVKERGIPVSKFKQAKVVYKTRAELIESLKLPSIPKKPTAPITRVKPRVSAPKPKVKPEAPVKPVKVTPKRGRLSDRERLSQTVGDAEIDFQRHANPYGVESEAGKKHLKSLADEMERASGRAGRWGKDVRLKKIELIDRDGWGRGVQGTYDPRSRRMRLATRELDGDKKLTVGKRTWRVSESTRSNIRHEYGHAVRREMWDTQAELDWGDLWDSRPKDHWAQAVSQYGATNKEELFAESFSAWAHPDYGKSGVPRLPKEVEQFFLKWMGAA